MHIISRSKLVEFWEKHPNAETSLRLWYKLTSLAQWQNFVELRQVFPSADLVSNLTVFNIGGNNYRLIVKFLSAMYLLMQNITKKTGKMTPGIPSTNAYIELLTSFPPRPITSEDELITTQKVIDSLIDKEELTSDEQDYLNVLGTLVHEYEEKSTTIPDIHGIELLKGLIDEFGLPENDLVSIFTTESIVSEVLSKKRQLTVTQISQLAEFFHISPAAFFELTFLQ